MSKTQWQVLTGRLGLTSAALAAALAGAAMLAQADDGAGRFGGPGDAPQAHRVMHRPGGPEGAGGAGLGPLTHPRLLDVVGATADQKNRLHDIEVALRTETEQRHDELRTLRQQLLAAMLVAKPDAAAAEALRQKLQAGQDALSKRALQAQLQASAVLTPEQRQKIADILKRRAQDQDERGDRPERGMRHPMRGEAPPDDWREGAHS